MMRTLIIGKDSNLSKYLHSKVDNSILISSREIEENINTLLQYKNKKINIIFNNFQQSTQLNNLDNGSDYITNTIFTTSKILDYFTGTEINKIIYTSSSSVYGNNILCKESDELKPLNLHSSLKIANEKLIEKYCRDRGVDFTITRIFNMYGGNDRFSVVSKIINAVKNGTKITIVNHGNAIRDFIHIDDVVKIYSKLLTKQVKTLNIGTGEGTSIKSLLDFLHYRGVKIEVENLARDELKTSTCDNSLLIETIDNLSFKKIEEYLVAELSL